MAPSHDQAAAMQIAISDEARQRAIQSIELHADAFGYWRKYDQARKRN